MREKKWLALGLTAVMTAGMLSACGKEAAQETAETKKEETDGNAAAEEGSAAKEKPYDGTELTFWMQSYGNDPSNQTEAMDKVTSDFLEKTGIDLELYPLPLQKSWVPPTEQGESALHGHR